ncbi:MAG TPA: hypothetical protein V6C97_21490 [Oculatellaceae cyanobacterium]
MVTAVVCVCVSVCVCVCAWVRIRHQARECAHRRPAGCGGGGDAVCEMVIHEQS